MKLKNRGTTVRDLQKMETDLLTDEPPPRVSPLPQANELSLDSN